MIVQFGTTSKRVNSTDIPTMTASYNCVLKEGSSVISPVIIIDRKVIGHNYNVAYIADFGRYYWIRDIVYENARQYFYLDCDVLASFKSEIGASTQYVLRSSYEYNEYVIDQYYPVSTHILQYTERLQGGTPLANINWLEYLPSRGLWVAGIINKSGVNYYAFDYSVFQSFMQYLYSDTFIEALLGITHAELVGNKSLKAAVDPLQYITQLVWLPFEPATGFSSTDVLIANDIDSGVDAGDVTGSSGVRTVWMNINIAAMPHPQSNDRGEYLNSPGFTEMRLVFPPFGTFELNALEFMQYDHVTVLPQVDCTNGIGKLRVYGYKTAAATKPDATIIEAQAQVGIPMPVAQVITPGLSVVDMAAKLGSAVVSAASGNVSGVLGASAAALDTYYNSKVPKASMVGSRGSLTAISGYPQVEYVWKYVVDEDNNDHGRPLCGTRQLSAIPGFQLIFNPHLSISGTAEESERVNSFLASGYFYE